METATNIPEPPRHIPAEPFRSATVVEAPPAPEPLPVAGNLEMLVTEKNLQDLIDGKTIQVAVFGGINLRMSLDKSVTRDVLVNLSNKAARDLPVLGNVPPRTEMTGQEVRL